MTTIKIKFKPNIFFQYAIIFDIQTLTFRKKNYFNMQTNKRLSYTQINSYYKHVLI